MKYLATVKENRDGLRLILWVKLLFFWFPMIVYRSLDTCHFIIDDDLKKWKKYHGEKLTIKDCRENNK